MAQKPTKSSKSPSRASSSKGKTVAPGSRARKSAGKSAPQQSSAHKQTASKPRRSKTTPGRDLRALIPWKRKSDKPSSPNKRAPRHISTGISLDRKLDILGIILTLAGLLTLLSLLSTSHSSPTGTWLNFLSSTFGWGAYVFPLGLMSFGLWLVLRNFERIPQLSMERFLGIILLYGNLLTCLHLLLLPTSRERAFAIAAEGQGGGYSGALILSFLQEYIGLGGAAVALLAWLIIGLALTLDTPVMDLFRWIPALVLHVQDWWDDRRNHVEERHGRPTLPFQPTQTLNPNSPVVEGNTPVEVQPGASAHPFYPPAEGHNWVLPRLEEILDEGSDVVFDDELDRQRARIVEETLASFGAPVNVVEINRGPTITQFGVEPDFIETRGNRMRVRVNKIASLADDLALALSARRIRVEAPVPGRGYVGIEVPNDHVAMVALRDVIQSEAFRRLKSPLRFALGQDVAGNAAAADLTGMPHLLIAGQTGSGKSVCVNTLIACLLLHNTPEDLRLVMVDPKRVELTGYNGIPHLLAPVVVEMDRVVGALQWVLREMDQRYHKLADLGTRNIVEYNARIIARGGKKLPYLVVIIDELADLMMLAPDETERTITRLAQLARATGIHLVIATQRPSVDVVTGLIKANFPARIAFAVASGVDSRVILDAPGADRLLGRGDMLFQAPDAPAALRLQGAFVSDTEIQRLVHYWRGFSNHAHTVPTETGALIDSVPDLLPLKQMPLWEEMKAEQNADPLLNEAIDLVRRQGRASISMLQRRLRIGYTRSARLIEAMQEKGIIGTESSGVSGFEVLDYGQAAPPIEEQGD